jgi:hypothetical protein
MQAPSATSWTPASLFGAVERPRPRCSGCVTRGRSPSTKHAAVRGFVAPAALIFVVFALTTVLGPVAVSRAATAQAAELQCKIVVKGAHWHIRGSGSGNKYTIYAEGMSCFAVRDRVSVS